MIEYAHNSSKHTFGKQDDEGKKMWWRRFRFTMKSVHLSQLNYWLHYILCTIALHVDIHLVCCCHVVISWEKEGTALSRLTGESSTTLKGPNYSSHFEMWGTQIKNNVQKISHFDLGPIPSIHPSTHSFIHINSVIIYEFIWFPTSSRTFTCAYVHTGSPLYHSLMHTSICPLFCVDRWISQRE